MNHSAPALVLSEGQRETLTRLARSRTAAHREVQRAQALLLAGEGVANTRIAEQVRVTAVTVRSWRDRFAAEGLKDLGVVRDGRGRKPSIPAETVEAIVQATVHAKPAGQTRWSCRTMAKQFGVSTATVQRIWSARGLKPHRVAIGQRLPRHRHEEFLC